MKRYEYKFLKRNVCVDSQTVLNQFCALGEQGFKYVGETLFQNYIHYIFMKEVDNEDVATFSEQMI